MTEPVSQNGEKADGSEAAGRERLNQLKELQNKSSMDYWWPRLESLDIPTPDTVRLEIAGTDYFQDGLKMPVPDETALHEAIKAVDGPPAFLRSDVTSRKHRMQASRIEDAQPSATVIAGVVEQHHLAMGMPMPSSYYVREWLDLYHEFKAWAYDHYDCATPIAAELRYFLFDGDLYDFGFYWPKEAITRPDRDDWEGGWQRTRDTAMHGVRVDAAEKYARRVADEFDTGYWSVDLALTERDQWYAIDRARGELSWHPDGIEQAVPDPRQRNLHTDK